MTEFSVHTIFRLAEQIVNGLRIEPATAVELMHIDDDDIFLLLSASDKIRSHFKGRKIKLCSIVNAKSGLCREDCAFCGQSAAHDTDAPTYELLAPARIIEAARRGRDMRSGEFSIVTSGTNVEKDAEVSDICEALEGIGRVGGMERCASLGIMSRESLIKLKKSGLESYHHNIETSRSYFPNICTTHEYDEDIETIRTAKELGLKTCCGGIIGLGESLAQRVEMAFTLKELDVDSVPLNFLNPIKGTRLAGMKTVPPLEALKTIAVFRFILPEKDILVSGGREVTFRDLQTLIFMAGANGTLIGNYLLTKGRNPDEILQMIEDLGLEIDG